jgi:hypothetical protein
VLRGAQARQYPREQPIRIEFVINLLPAKALSLPISQSLLATADEVIE